MSQGLYSANVERLERNAAEAREVRAAWDALGLRVPVRLRQVEAGRSAARAGGWVVAVAVAGGWREGRWGRAHVRRGMRKKERKPRKPRKKESQKATERRGMRWR